MPQSTATRTISNPELLRMLNKYAPWTFTNIEVGAPPVAVCSACPVCDNIFLNLEGNPHFIYGGAKLARRSANEPGMIEICRSDLRGGEKLIATLESEIFAATSDSEHVQLHNDTERRRAANIEILKNPHQFEMLENALSALRGMRIVYCTILREEASIALESEHAAGNVDITNYGETLCIEHDVNGHAKVIRSVRELDIWLRNLIKGAVITGGHIDEDGRARIKVKDGAFVVDVSHLTIFTDTICFPALRY